MDCWLSVMIVLFCLGVREDALADTDQSSDGDDEEFARNLVQRQGMYMNWSKSSYNGVQRLGYVTSSSLEIVRILFKVELLDKSRYISYRAL